MDTNDTPAPDAPEATRRGFLRAGAAALALGAGPPAIAANHDDPARPADDARDERRNKQAGMAYRRLGRTGMMISEVVCGGDPITSKNYKHLERALERGLNYLDMAPAYNGGDTERAYGKLLAGSPSMRERVFLTTKVSDFNRVRTRLYTEIFDGLPGVAAGGDPPQGPRDQGAATAGDPRLLPDLLPRPARGLRVGLSPGGHAARVRRAGRGQPGIAAGDRASRSTAASSGSGPTTSTC